MKYADGKSGMCGKVRIEKCSACHTCFFFMEPVVLKGIDKTVTQTNCNGLGSHSSLQTTLIYF